MLNCTTHKNKKLISFQNLFSNRIKPLMHSIHKNSSLLDCTFSPIKIQRSINTEQKSTFPQSLKRENPFSKKAKLALLLNKCGTVKKSTKKR